MVEKDRSVILNKTYLMKILPPLYQNSLENQLEPSELLFLSLMINVLQGVKQVSLEKLATVLPLPILFESRRKKIQRFLSLPIFNIETLWFPIIEKWLGQNFVKDQAVYIVIDRTSWGRLNLIMISIIYAQRAIPVYWQLLPKLGSTNLAEQTTAISRVLQLFTRYKPVVLGDREFCSVNLASWLREQGVHFCLRLKKSEFVATKNGSWQQLDELGLKPVISLFLSEVKVTKSQKVTGFNLACKWNLPQKGCDSKEGWFSLTNLSNLQFAIAAYKRRFCIEEMFRDFKSGGYNLENSNVSGNRLIAVVLLIAFAYSISAFTGENIKQKGMQKYVGRVKEYGRVPRRHSSFYQDLRSWIENETRSSQVGTNSIPNERQLRLIPTDASCEPMQFPAQKGTNG